VQPSYFIYLEIDPDQIDVNVHPQKTEVKFINKSAVHQIVNAAVRETLAKSGAVPMMDFDDEERLEIPVLGGHAGYGEPGSGTGLGAGSSAGLGGHSGHPGGFSGGSTGYQGGGSGAGFGGHHGSGSAGYSGGFSGGGSAGYSGGFSGGGQGSYGGQTGLQGGNYGGQIGHTGYPAGAFREPASVRSGDYNPFTKYGGTSDFEYVSGGDDAVQSAAFDDEPKVFSSITNIGGGYAVAFFGRRFVAVDLRRAREAVLFDRFRTTIQSGHSATQQLLFPERMALSAEDRELLKDHEQEFAAFGFDIRATGDSHSVDIAGVPADLASERLDEVVYEMIDALRDGIFTGDDARREKLAAAMARAGAGNGSVKPSHAELESLLTSLAATENPTFTPAGRPVMVEITLDDIKIKLR
jgi:DNA mismatch repair protein MutL